MTSGAKRRPTGLEVAAADEPFVFASQTYEGSLIVLGCKLALAVPTVQQAWASSGVRTGDRIVAVNGTAGPAEKLLPRTVNGTGHTGPSKFCATSI